ncbi:hypothetical protein PT974_02797 [Cladobotryum mycophilum]|uniref:Vps72/YL1 C-terminal domain-containing protein n=1 Tax=Cladobotryum mycophilum TaxID=491253 RepID=A0ABR0T0B0_9HYPO
MTADFHTNSNPKSNILALPNTSQHTPTPAPPSLIQGQTRQHISDTNTTSAKFVPKDITIETIKNQAALMSKSASPSLSESVPQSATESSADLTTTTRNTIIFQNFDENAIKDKSIQTQLLFGRKMNKLSKPPPNPICVITNLPARYRDPKTGLPYYNAYAYREIQRLSRGEHRWSKILNAWVGSGTVAARGVPERFLNPNAPSKTAEEKAKLAQAKEQAAQKKEDELQAKVNQPQPQPQPQQQETQQSPPLQLQTKPVQTPMQQSQQTSQQQPPQQPSQQVQQPIRSQQPPPPSPIPAVAEASKTQNVTSQPQPQSLPMAHALPESQSQPHVQPPPT